MDFENASHGLSLAGVQNFINDLNVQVFDAVRSAIDDNQDVIDAVNQGWVGNAADNFIRNILTGAQQARNDVDMCRETLMTQIESIQSEILDMDETMVELEG